MRGIFAALSRDTSQRQVEEEAVFASQKAGITDNTWWRSPCPLQKGDSRGSQRLSK